MDGKGRLCPSTVNQFPEKGSSELQPLSGLNAWRDQQKLEDASFPDHGIRIDSSFLGYGQSSDPAASSIPCDPSNQMKNPGRIDGQLNFQNCRNRDWDPKEMLNNLSFLEQKIHQLQDLVHLIVGQRGQAGGQPDELITSGLTSIIVQLMYSAGSLLPSVSGNTLLTPNHIIGQLGGVVRSSEEGTSNGGIPQSMILNPSRPTDSIGDNHGNEQNYASEEHELKDDDDAEEGEHLPPGSYEILQLEKEEILAPHTHFCVICGKGFKRDANLRMHMRGHGDEYKSPAALAKPHKESGSEHMLLFKRYSCPYAGCKRNKDHKKFQPLKTILCVKNHYKRSHCDKRYTCSRCNVKKFSVMADLKTHEKHCGRDKWLCSCGTTFSRKDKLFGHIALFQGHTPAIHLDDKGSSGGPSNHRETNEAANKIENIKFDYSPNLPTGNMLDSEGNIDDRTAACSSELTFGACNLSGFDEFPQPPFEDSGSLFSFLIPGCGNYDQKTIGDLSSK